MDSGNTTKFILDAES